MFSKIFVRMKVSKCNVLKNLNSNQNTLQNKEKQWIIFSCCMATPPGKALCTLDFKLAKSIFLANFDLSTSIKSPFVA